MPGWLLGILVALGLYAVLLVFAAVDTRLSSAGKRSALEQRLVMRRRKRRIEQELRRIARDPHSVNPERSRAEIRREQMKWR